MLVLVFTGCSPTPSSKTSYVETSADNAPASAEAFDGRAMEPTSLAGKSGNWEAAGADEKDSTLNQGENPALDFNRQIIYTARLSVTVETFDPVPEQVIELVERFGGYISETNVGKMQGTRRSGSWRIRVPVAKYRDFLNSAGGLGVPESLTENAQDVTEEFYDLEARISSSRKLEEQIMKLLEKDTDKIDDLIAVERELSRVRLEIERMEGRKRYLQNMVGMSTIYLTVREQLTFVPAEKPSMGKRISTEWSEAIHRARRSMENTVLYVVANVFQLATTVIVLLIAWLWVRRWFKKGKKNAELS
jgi:hypothetical protein